MTFNLHNIHFLPHNKLWKFLWYFEIQTVSNILYDFLVSQTNYSFFGFKLHCLHSGEPLYVLFIFSFIFIFLLRNRENLYGISKFKSFATWSSLSPYVTVFQILGSRCTLLFVTFVFLSFALRYRANSHGILTFREFAT